MQFTPTPVRSTLHSPWGPMTLAAHDSALVWVGFDGQKHAVAGKKIGWRGWFAFGRAVLHAYFYVYDIGRIVGVGFQAHLTAVALLFASSPQFLSPTYMPACEATPPNVNTTRSPV